METGKSGYSGDGQDIKMAWICVFRRSCLEFDFLAGRYDSISQSAKVWLSASKPMPTFTTGNPHRAKRSG